MRGRGLLILMAAIAMGTLVLLFWVDKVSGLAPFTSIVHISMAAAILCIVLFFTYISINRHRRH